MSNVNEAMLTILSLDRDASLLLSPWTRQWYIQARIEVGDGVSLTGICEHRDSPEEAVFAYLDALKEVDQGDFDHFLVSNAMNREKRRHWRWNGAAFTEVPR